MRFSLPRDLAQSQLQNIWRPVWFMALVILMTGCNTHASGPYVADFAVIPSPVAQWESQSQNEIIGEGLTLTPTAQAPTATPTTLAVTPAPQPATESNQVQAASVGQSSGETSRITGYYCHQVEGFPLWDGGGYCGNMSSGRPVYVGAAACGAKWQLGTRLNIEGYGIVVCEDRGHLGFSQVDIFFESNQTLYQSYPPGYAVVNEVP